MEKACNFMLYLYININIKKILKGNVTPKVISYVKRLFLLYRSNKQLLRNMYTLDLDNTKSINIKNTNTKRKDDFSFRFHSILAVRRIQVKCGFVYIDIYISKETNRFRLMEGVTTFLK